MAFSTWLIMLLTHPNEFRTLLQYKLYYEPKRDLTAQEEHPTSGWDRETMRRCWAFLDLTSRSFSSVIKELEGDLARGICMFYLVLRGLDTIEDDMTLDPALKQSLLRNFHIHSTTPGWNFSGSGPDESDRQLLVEYQVVVEELNHLPASYRTCILDYCQKMGTGMADFAARAENEKQSKYVERIADYELYCHYVAGIVGEGCSILFSASGKESPHLAEQLELSNSMGLLLQKTNITRDFAEDVDEQRYFWPREIWGDARYGGFERPEDMRTPPPGTLALPGVQDRAVWVLNAMVLDALRHTTDALDYLRMLKNQSVFNFVAIPATMSIATLELCFMNPKVLNQNVKIRKAMAASLIMRSTNPREVAHIFRDYARKISARAVAQDPNFIRISVACGKIEQWCERYYPSFVMISASAQGGIQQRINPSDARGATFLEAEKRENERTSRARLEKLVAAGRKPAVEDDGALRTFAMYFVGGTMMFLGVLAAVVYFITQLED
ncbi:squalene synthase [Favolaschia claudopus]|uniref:Squalene synthase n=1 Tax=Favolaschia claudopus TaxID=2862362 RepID=A0AAW0BFG7_9AGAR